MSRRQLFALLSVASLRRAPAAPVKALGYRTASEVGLLRPADIQRLIRISREVLEDAEVLR